MGKKPTFLCKFSWCWWCFSAYCYCCCHTAVSRYCSALLCYAQLAVLLYMHMFVCMCDEVYFCGVEMKKHFSVLQKETIFISDETMRKTNQPANVCMCTWVCVYERVDVFVSTRKKGFNNSLLFFSLCFILLMATHTVNVNYYDVYGDDDTR